MKLLLEIIAVALVRLWRKLVNWYAAADRFAERMMPYFLFVVTAGIVGIILFFWTLSRNHVPPDAPPTPSFVCYQTLTTDDARKLSADLWSRASAGEQTRLVVGCKSGVTRLKLERVK